jgi:hypothetical protein
VRLVEAGVAGGDIDQSFLTLIGFLLFVAGLLTVLAYLEPGNDLAPLYVRRRLAVLLS